MMAQSLFKIIAGWGTMQQSTAEFLVDFVKAESEEEVRYEFNRNIVNRHFGREIISVQKIKDLSR